MTELLTMEDFGEDTNEMIKSVYDSSNRLLQLLSNLLESARLEAGKLKLEHIGFSLQAVIRDALQLVSREAAKKSLQVESFCDSRLPAEICGDEYKLGQILTNLAFNAVKFTNMGSITLACNLVSETASSVVVQFSVSDMGIGIKASDQEKLFQPFVQADDAVVRLYGGSGLGLSICKQLVELMGGRIGLKSEPGAGSTFWFEIPFDKVDCVVTDFDNDDDA
jgi:signal transduction histidine kinase